MNIATNIKAVEDKDYGHGDLQFNLGWRGGFEHIKVYGGPYDGFPSYLGDKAFGVCVRAERTDGRVIDAHIPLQDFTTPSPEQLPLVRQVLKMAIDAALAGKVVYVGCMGGYGRTGLFLAILAKSLGIADPVKFIRQNYTSHAVETAAQQTYVADFDVTPIQKHLFWAGWKRHLRRLIWE